MFNYKKFDETDFSEYYQGDLPPVLDTTVS